MTYTKSRAFENLCEAGVVRLTRAEPGWGLQILLAPDNGRTQWYAAGALFAEIEELDEQARFLLRWVQRLESRTS